MNNFGSGQSFEWRGITFRYGLDDYSASLTDRDDKVIAHLTARRLSDSTWQAWVSGRPMVTRPTAAQALDDACYGLLLVTEQTLSALKRIGIER